MLAPQQIALAQESTASGGESGVEDLHHLVQIDNPIDMLIHELKQPLWCILVLGERLQNMIGEIPPEAYAKHSVLKRDVASLLVSVQQMREIMTARTALAHLENVEQGWGLRMAQYCQALETTANARGVALVIENTLTDSETGPDPKALNQVLSNLVTNAVEALEDSDSRSIILELGSEVDSLVIRVHDSGSGVPEELQMKIFDKGFSTKLFRGGSGYGLWVCKKLVEALGGTLTVSRSDRLGGALFHAELPSAHPITLDNVA